jgi:hypothetical protein
MSEQDAGAARWAKATDNVTRATHKEILALLFEAVDVIRLNNLTDHFARYADLPPGEPTEWCSRAEVLIHTRAEDLDDTPNIVGRRKSACVNGKLLLGEALDVIESDKLQLWFTGDWRTRASTSARWGKKKP